MTRTERNEFNYIKRSLKAMHITADSEQRANLTIRTNASAEYKQALHSLYTSVDYHPASVTIDTHRFDDNERIIYIKGIVTDGYHWTSLYTAMEKEMFASALTDEWISREHFIEQWKKANEETEKVYFDGTTTMGCYIQNAMVILPKDYTMNQLVSAIKEAGYTSFKLSSMNRLVFIEETEASTSDASSEETKTEANKMGTNEEIKVSESILCTNPAIVINNMFCQIHKAIGKRSAWALGLKEYADEIFGAMLDAVKDGYAEYSDFISYSVCKRIALNGASDWKEYSYGGCSLIYNQDIAERLCSASELKKTANGSKKPNASEEWIDVQARALSQAFEYVYAVCKANKSNLENIEA